ncbi:MAG: acyl-CoA thioesterase [Proteobacteria bacterium]|jgi:acyl-CoA thioesterase FadM|nr:acyl-CoA thioesterase [Pseudomonadota bacterium]|tara:strand:+ start:4258 stop:4788 length:531 start_codon:yes stop_codon:yes gene_type:complete
MYPFLRLGFHMISARFRQPLNLYECHISHHLCWPHDLDLWGELNNGRTLTLFDLGRVPMGRRMGLRKILLARGWNITVAGNCTRYRKRITLFNRLEMRSRLLGWDDKFLYIDQSLWRAGTCTTQLVVRHAIFDKNGIITPQRLMDAYAGPQVPPKLPAWVQSWSQAESLRPWPPQD